MTQPRYYRVLTRTAPKESFATRLLRGAEHLFEWLAAYPPYTLGGEEASLHFDEYRALAMADGGTGPRTPSPDR